jgi:UDP-2,3-diacylglucosamine pyrophosphatase LpxH
MSKIIFSDVHIGHPDFFHKDAFISFLASVCSHHDEVIIAGDLFELWMNTKSGIEERYSDVILLLNALAGQTKVTFVPGNHDYLHKNIVKFSNIVYPNYQFKVKDRTFTVTHGHNQSMEARWKYYKLVRIFMDMQIFSTLFYKLFSMPELYPLELLYKKYTATKSDDICGELEKGAERLPGYVIMGHSHIPMVKCHYANCGNWLSNKTYLVISDEGEVELKDYEDFAKVA